MLNRIAKFMHSMNWKHDDELSKIGFRLVQCSCGKIADVDVDPWDVGAFNWRNPIAQGSK